MPTIEIDVQLFEVQEYVFFECTKKFCIYPKGGRAGMTHGAAICISLLMLQSEKPIRVLWGDVQSKNTERYFEQFFMPFLKQLPKTHWKYRKGMSRVEIGNSFLDFRFMANPHSWEGQGYELIYINEAGIVLKNSYIWEQVILKSMLDAGDDARCIISGVPKGTANHFATLIETAKQKMMAGDSDWDFRAITTYDNPTIPKKKIDKMRDENPQIARQEIYGEVLGAEEHPFQVFPNDWVALSMQDHAQYIKANPDWKKNAPTRSAIDPSLGGDECTFSWLYGVVVDFLSAYTGDQVNQSPKVANKFWTEHLSRCKGLEGAKACPIHIDYPGIGEGVYSQVAAYKPKHISKMLPTGAVNRQNKERTYTIKDAKTWWAWTLREKLDPANPNRVLLPNDPVLQTQLASYRYDVGANNVIKLWTKDKQKALLGGTQSPDRGDNVIYLCADITYMTKASVYVL